MPNQMKMSPRSSGNPTNDPGGARLRDAASRGQGCRDLTNMRRGGGTVIQGRHFPSFVAAIVRATTIGSTRLCSLRLNPKLLDAGPPFLRVRPLQRAKRLRGLPFARKNLKSEIDQARSHCGIGQRLDGRRV